MAEDVLDETGGHRVLAAQRLTDVTSVERADQR
jgi:hypothetical protein